MEDLIARVFAYDDNPGPKKNADTAINDVRNSSRFFEPLEKATEEPLGRTSRETTAPLDEINISANVDDNSEGWRISPGLKLTFSHPPKAGSGYLLGTDSNVCDIVLPALPSISRRHCYLAFDSNHHLIVRDCSTYGTTVTYDDEGGQKRRRFTWIIGGHEIPAEAKKIIIQVHQDLRLQVVVPKPSFPLLYRRNVDAFNERIRNNELALTVLGIESTISTADPSGLQTPSQDPILLTRETLGKGMFSVVRRVWDVSSGLEYASKEFVNISSSDWRLEASLMKQTSHDHIIKLIFELEDPVPQLVLEYLPLGNLRDQHYRQNISDIETALLLQQGLQALAYLHDQSPPIIHRDIKPENILIQSRTPFRIKLADFGLSKAGEYLRTFCGTMLYAAPEVMKYYGSAEPGQLKYHKAVDIWSFGVVVYEYGFGLPARPQRIDCGLPWCEKVIAKMNDEDTDDLLDVLATMLVMEGRKRASAADCLTKALLLSTAPPETTRLYWTDAAGSQDHCEPEVTIEYDYSKEHLQAQAQEIVQVSAVRQDQPEAPAVIDAHGRSNKRRRSERGTSSPSSRSTIKNPLPRTAGTSKAENEESTNRKAEVGRSTIDASRAAGVLHALHDMAPQASLDGDDFDLGDQQEHRDSD